MRDLNGIYSPELAVKRWALMLDNIPLKVSTMTEAEALEKNRGLINSPFKWIPQKLATIICHENTRKTLLRKK